MSGERRFREFSYDELITLEFAIESMIGTGSYARPLKAEIQHEMHCQRHESAGLPEPLRREDYPSDKAYETALEAQGGTMLPGLPD